MENYSYNSLSYPESGHSSPRSREIDFENPPPWEDSSSNQPPPNYKVKLMCSYGGKIQPRPHDNQLSYIGGETKILAVDRTVRFGSLLAKMIALCDGDAAISLKYQLPGEDLDSLISVTNDDDLDHMMHEYDRLYRVSPKPARLRIFIFSSGNSSSAAGFGSDEAKTEREMFVEALNSTPMNTPVQKPASPAPAVQSQPQPQPNPPAGNADFLFGLEKGNPGVGAQPVQQRHDPVLQQRVDERLIPADPIQKHIHDLERLRIEEQQELNRRKTEEIEYFKGQEKISQVGVPAGVPCWAQKQGVFPTSTVSNDQPVYVIQAPAGSYQPQMVRHVNPAPSQGQGYYVQRMPSDIYRDQQQQQLYSMIPPGTVTGMSSQKVTGYPESFQMVRPGAPGVVGMVTEAGYAAASFDAGPGRQVIYSAQGGLMTSAAPVPAPQYHVVAGAEARQTGGLSAEPAGKFTKTQASV